MVSLGQVGRYIISEKFVDGVGLQISDSNLKLSLLLPLRIFQVRPIRDELLLPPQFLLALCYIVEILATSAGEK